ncbi:Na+/H+ antiporter subunit B [Cytophagaceae bacterium ABcell3]|nr:Na+/H+ antiporter subunit B [Cytophagaceae bacterium ABcell3]
MISLILSTATKYLLPILIMFALFMLIRGHYEPGGGFVGGLAAAAAFALYTISNGVEKARDLFPARPSKLTLTGLVIALGSGLVSLFTNETFFKGEWLNFDFPVVGPLGTPLMFDIGVFLVVIGVTMNIVFTLAEE